jgi:sn1-specific diacylglycerol lipase
MSHVCALTPEKLYNLGSKPCADKNPMAEKSDNKSDEENQVFVVPESMKTSNLATATSFGLDVASVSTTVGLDIAKLSTKMGFLIAKRSIDAVSWLVNPQSDDDVASQVISWSNSPISALLAAASAGVSFGKAVSIGSMNVASTVVTTSLETAKDSIETLNTLFGSTDTARCLEEFVQLVKREWVVKEEDRHLLPDKFADFTIVGTIKALTAWAAIQKVTDDHWNKEVLKSCTELATFTQWLDDDDSRTLYSESEADSQPHSDPIIPLQEPEDKETMIVTGKEEDEQGTVFEGTIEPSAPLLFTADVVSTNMGWVQNTLSGAQRGSGRRGSSAHPFIEENNNNIEEVLHSLKRYSKFSMGAYGRTFMRMFGLALPPIPTETSHINPNFITFAHYTSTSLDNVIGFPNAQEDTEKNDKSYAPSYYLIKDHDSKSIILSFRGTYSLNDLAIDLTCDYDDFVLPGDQSPRTYRVHSGLHGAAKAIYHGGSGVLMTAIKQALVENDGYGKQP